MRLSVRLLATALVWAVVVQAGGEASPPISSNPSRSKTFQGPVAQQAAGTIRTFAGNGGEDFGGDDGPATDASLLFPYDVTVDPRGNIVIADSENGRIRRVDPSSGTITTIAGTGEPGFAGDGGPATSAQLSFPTGLTYDGDGNLYIADSDNHRVRRVDTSGNISTVAGNGTAGFGGDGGPATEARLNFPIGLAIDANGNLVIADTDNQRVRRVNLREGTIATIAGDGRPRFGGDDGPATAASLWFPEDVAFDAAGNLYIAETGDFQDQDLMPGNNRIRRVDASGVISTFAGTGSFDFGGDDGPANAAAFRFPSGLAVDGGGNVYVMDEGNLRIRRIDGATRAVTTVAGNGRDGFTGDGGPALSARFSSPKGMAFDAAGNLYFADAGNNRVRVIQELGTPRQSRTRGGKIR